MSAATTLIADKMASSGDKLSPPLPVDEETQQTSTPSRHHLLYAAAASPTEASGAHAVTREESAGLKRGLSQRHISMTALAGAIGTGLFVGLGSSIRTAGPLGALLGYTVVGLLVCTVQFAIGETAALLPLTGGFVRHAEILADPALGFALGWNLVYGNLLSSIPEIAAICILFDYWWPQINNSVFIILFIILTGAVGFSSIRVFGEVEFGMAILKIASIVFINLFGLVVTFGGIPGTDAIGFRYYRDPGPFVEYLSTGSWAEFLGFWSVMSTAVFAFSGTESPAMAAAEVRNPHRAIPKACKRVFMRVTLFYLVSILIAGMLVASDDPKLNSDSGDATQSPFVIAANVAGLPAVGSVVNAIVITSAWSSGNAALLSGSRVLYGLALKGQAPRIFLRTTRWGCPYVCVSLFIAFMFLGFLTLSAKAMTVFRWFVDLTAGGTLVCWIAMLVNHIRLRLALSRQGYSYKQMPWSSRWTFHSSCIGLGFAVILLLTNGWTTFTKGGWDTADFISAYLDIPLVIAAFCFWKYYKKTRWIPLREVPVAAILKESEQSISRWKEEKQSRGWMRLVSWLWD